MRRVARSAPLSARTPGKTLSLERRGCPANSMHAATLGNARKIAQQRRDAIVATGPRWRHGAAQTRRRARKTGFAHRGKDTAKPWAGDPRHGKLGSKTTALPRTGLRGFKGASVRDAKARGAKSDAKGKGAGRPHLTLRLRFYPPPGPKNQGVTNGPPAGEAGDRRRERLGPSLGGPAAGGSGTASQAHRMHVRPVPPVAAALGCDGTSPSGPLGRPACLVWVCG